MKRLRHIVLLAGIMMLTAPTNSLVAQKPGSPPSAPSPALSAPAPKNAREHRERAIASLLARLKKAKGPEEAQALRDKLTAAWSRSGPASARALLQQAARAQADGLLETARGLYDLVVKRWPGYESGRFRRAYFLWQMGQSEAALAELKLVLSQNPDYFPAIVLRIHILEQQKRWSDALGACERLRQVSPHWKEWDERCRRMRLRFQRDI